MNTPLRSTLLLLAAGSLAGPALHAAVPNRLQANAALATREELPQSVSARVRNSTALGHLSGDTTLQTMSLVLAPSAAQSAALDQLLADQQNPGSASYHHWLTPEQFGERFGVSDHDLNVLENWLTGQGLQVLSVARSRNGIAFSGSATNVESAFSTQLNRYSRNGQEFFENSSAPQVPAAFNGLVTGITGLSSYRLQPHAAKPVLRPNATPAGFDPQATSTTGTTHYLVPWDFRQIYDANTLYNSGRTGSGLTIGVIGQSAVDTTQVTYFQTLTGQTGKAPTLMLVPNTGTSTRITGDEGESEADLEYATGVAPGATVNFIYTGYTTNSTYGVIDALEYAITNNLGNILTLSYGGCETANSVSAVNGVELYLKQANAQGQTVVVSSGDSGAAGCDVTPPTAYDGAQVSYPASSPYVSAIGGTIFTEGSGTYWSTSNNGQLGSALGYIPEAVWNETSSTSFSASGGGYSRIFSKPSWQTGTGVPADGARDIPDISFSAASGHDPYLLCTSDTGYQGTNSSGQKVTGACTSTTFGSFVVGGTSLSTPSFAGTLAIAENANSIVGLGNINPILYSLSTTAGVFHDITSGTNQISCASGTIGCSNGLIGYAATTGYDLATGLGSVDIGNFSTALPAAIVANKPVPTVAITVTSTTSTSSTLTIRVSSNTNSTVPTGTVNISVDGGTPTAVALTSGSASYTLSTSNLSVGNHTVTAAYTGDTTYKAATGNAIVAVSGATGSLTLATDPSTLTINTASATSGSWKLTTASNAGFSGLVVLSVAAATGSSVPTAGCFLGQSDFGIASGSSVGTTITYSFKASDCTSTSTQKVLANFNKANSTGTATVSATGAAPSRQNMPMLAIGFTGLLGSALLRRRRLWMTGLLAVTFLAATAGLSGCGSGTAALSGTTTTNTVTKGTYNLVFKVASYPGSTITATSNVSLVLQ